VGIKQGKGTAQEGGFPPTPDPEDRDTRGDVERIWQAISEFTL